MLCLLAGARLHVLVLVAFCRLVMPGDDQGRPRELVLQVRLLIPLGFLGELKGEAAAVGLELEHLCILAVELSTDVGEARIIVDLADIHHEEVIDEVLPQDEEDSVVFLSEAHPLPVDW